MPTSAEPVYLDSSGLVKLVVGESESAALQRFFGSRQVRVTCALARTEVVRAVMAQGPAAVASAQRLLRQLKLVHVDNATLDRASLLQPPTLRSLDAIHVAAALRAVPPPGEIVTYDRRMQEAARELGFTVVAPA